MRSDSRTDVPSSRGIRCLRGFKLTPGRKHLLTSLRLSCAAELAVISKSQLHNFKTRESTHQFKAFLFLNNSGKEKGFCSFFAHVDLKKGAGGSQQLFQVHTSRNAVPRLVPGPRTCRGGPPSSAHLPMPSASAGCRWTEAQRKSHHPLARGDSPSGQSASASQHTEPRVAAANSLPAPWPSRSLRSRSYARLSLATLPCPELAGTETV